MRLKKLSLLILLSVSFTSLLTAFAKPSSVIQPIPAKSRLYDTVPVVDAPAPKQNKVPEDAIFERVEIEADFPGGTEAWFQYLQKNLNPSIPVDKGAPAGSYTVIIQFVVDVDGKLSEFKPLTKHGYGMEAEVMRIIRKSPPWSPAKQDGRSVKAYRKQPVTFQIIDDRKKKKRG